MWIRTRGCSPRPSGRLSVPDGEHHLGAGTGEELSTRLGSLRAATMAQSFHWMDRARVAKLLHGLLTGDGMFAFVHATTHQGSRTQRPSVTPSHPAHRSRSLCGTTSAQSVGRGRGTARASGHRGGARSHRSGDCLRCWVTGPVPRFGPAALTHHRRCTPPTVTQHRIVGHDCVDFAPRLVHVENATLLGARVMFAARHAAAASRAACPVAGRW